MNDQERRDEAEFRRLVTDLVEKADPDNPDKRTGWHGKTVAVTLEIPRGQAATYLLAEITQLLGHTLEERKALLERFQEEPFSDELLALLRSRLERVAEHTHRVTRKYLRPVNKPLSQEDANAANPAILDVVAAVRVLGNAAQQIVHYDKHGDGISPIGAESVGELLLEDAISYLARGDTGNAQELMTEFDEWVSNGRASWAYTGETHDADYQDGHAVANMRHA